MPTVGKQKQCLGLLTILRRSKFIENGRDPLRSCSSFSQMGPTSNSVAVSEIVWQFHSLTSSVFSLTNVYVCVCDTAVEDKAVTSTQVPDHMELMF